MDRRIVVLHVSHALMREALGLPDNVDVIGMAPPWKDPAANLVSDVVGLLVEGECCPQHSGGGAIYHATIEELTVWEEERLAKIEARVVNVGDKFVILDDFKNNGGHGSVLTCTGIGVGLNPRSNFEVRVLFYIHQGKSLSLTDTQVRKITD